MGKLLDNRSTFEINLEKIMPNGKAMILAYDQGFEHGPRDFKENLSSVDPEVIINIAKEGSFTGLVLHGGIAKKYREAITKSKVPLILKLNGTSQVYTGDDPYSPLLYGKDAEEAVEWALKLEAKAVGYTVYTGSKYENLMNREFAQIVIAAHRLSLPVIGWMYPRGKYVENDTDPQIVAYAARIGLELGADIIKVKYTGDAESFNWVVKTAGATKVVMSGGPRADVEETFLNQVKEVLVAGGAGVAVGRNVWQNKNPLEISKKLKGIIFK